MAKSKLCQKGIELRSQLLGESFTNRMNESTYNDPVMQKFRDVTAETVLGALWTRPGLDAFPNPNARSDSRLETRQGPSFGCCLCTDTALT